jgi:hypothetical protein
MKARITPKRLSRSEERELTSRVRETFVPAVTSAILYVLYRRGWHKDKLHGLYKDIVALFKYPQAFDKWLDDITIQNVLSERIGIDWQELVDAVKVAGVDEI